MSLCVDDRLVCIPEINIHDKELWVKLVIYVDYTETHGQQNIRLSNNISEDLNPQQHHSQKLKCHN